LRAADREYIRLTREVVEPVERGILGRVAATDSASAREDASLNLTHDIIRALHADRTVGNRVADVRAQSIQVDGAELGIPGAAVTYIRATAKWLASSGV
jgi:hypothetical protein